MKRIVKAQSAYHRVNAVFCIHQPATVQRLFFGIPVKAVPQLGTIASTELVSRHGFFLEPSWVRVRAGP